MSREAAVRDALDRYISHVQSDEKQKTIYEFWVPLTHERADVTVIGSVMHAFEIKTSHDTLRRLPRQAKAYARVFDRCTAVVAECHLKSIKSILPEWWGILLISGNESPAISSVRDPRRNPKTDPKTLVRLLWREEAQLALSDLGVELPPKSGRVAMWNELLRIVDAEELAEIVREAFRRRRTKSVKT